MHTEQDSGNKTTNLPQSSLKTDNAFVLKVLSSAKGAFEEQNDFTCPKAVGKDLRKSCT